MQKFIYLIIFTAYGVLPCHAQYQDGLDVSFGSKGIVTFGESIVKPAGFVDGALQADGKIITITGKNIIRLNSDGSIDKTFADNGIFHEVLRDENDTLLTGLYHSINYSALEVQTDGKILVVGGSYPSWSKILILRLLPDGSRDLGFGKNGVVCNDIFGYNKYVNNVLIQPDGKILVSGYQQFSTYVQMLVRYQANGMPDSSFGTNGMVLNTAAVTHGYGNGLALQPDGKILVQYDGFGMARYLDNGSLDTSFNHTGMASVFSGATAPFSSSMALRPDGRIWICGSTLFDKNTPFVLARMNGDGSVDDGFDASGYKTYSWDTGDANKCRDMLLLPDGKVMLGGRVMNKETKKENFALMRILEGGKLDNSFGNKGVLLTQINGPIDLGDEFYKFLIQPDLKILAFGYSVIPATTATDLLSTIVRYESNGTHIDDPEKENRDVRIYPNPAKSKLYISNNDHQKITAVQIKDLSGRILYQSYNPQTNEVDINALACGSYIFSVFFPNSPTYHQTIIVSH